MFARNDKLAEMDQGSLVCADWPGSGPVLREHYVSASDIGAFSDLRGLQLIRFTAFGAGSPSKTDFAFVAGGNPEIAPQPFVSPLAKRLLGRRRGASALIAHVDKTWDSSFTWTGAGPQIQTFVNAVGAALSGKPIGLAQRHFSARYAELATNLASKLVVDAGYSKELVQLRMATVDARNYIVFGDPAARIAL